MNTQEDTQDCAFQYAWRQGAIRTAGFSMSGDPVIVEDTPLITFNEALELWNKHLPDFIKHLRAGEEPEMVIWTGMQEIGDYRHDTWHIDHSFETDGKRVFKTERVYVEPTKQEEQK